MANDFIPIAACKGLWRFESGALTTDSMGLNAALTAVGTPDEDAVDYKEGSCCVDLESGSTESYYIADASLTAGFPLKNGDTTKTLTWCCWFKPESIGSANYMISKYDSANNKRSLALVLTNSGGNQITALWGYGTGGSSEIITVIPSPSLTINTGEWYHVGLVVDGVNKTIYFRVYRASLQTVATYSTTVAQVLNVEDAQFRIGGRSGDNSFTYDGRIDEVVVFSSLLSAADIDEIRNQTYNVADPETLNLSLSMESITIAGIYAYQPFIIF